MQSVNRWQLGANAPDRMMQLRLLVQGHLLNDFVSLNHGPQPLSQASRYRNQVQWTCVEAICEHLTSQCLLNCHHQAGVVPTL